MPDWIALSRVLLYNTLKPPSSHDFCKLRAKRAAHLSTKTLRKKRQALFLVGHLIGETIAFAGLDLDKHCFQMMIFDARSNKLACANRSNQTVGAPSSNNILPYRRCNATSL